MDLKANASLSFEDFDQKGALPGSARKLVDAGCWNEAAEATQHYLVHGALATDRQQRILAFHLAQQLANAGRDREAAQVVASTRHPDEDATQPGALRWNDFVRGHYAFFVKDRALLANSIAALKAGEGRGNQLNASLLQGLDRCFDKPYGAAVKAPCRVLPPSEVK
jgi:hypothetical protein